MRGYSSHCGERCGHMTQQNAIIAEVDMARLHSKAITSVV
jgi:hypothetical protein